MNLGAATRRLAKTLNSGISAEKEPRAIAEDLIAEGRAVADEDVGRNKEMAKWAGEWLMQRVRDQGLDFSRGLNVLTVCNTGSLATSVRVFWAFYFGRPFSVLCVGLRNCTRNDYVSSRDSKIAKGLLYPNRPLPPGLQVNFVLHLTGMHFNAQLKG